MLYINTITLNIITSILQSSNLKIQLSDLLPKVDFFVQYYIWYICPIFWTHFITQVEVVGSKFAKHNISLVG